MTPVVVGLCIAGTGLLAVLAWHLVRPLKNLGRDVGLSVFHEDRTEDEPVETIDEALAATTDRAEQDALLDVRLRAMGGAG